MVDPELDWLPPGLYDYRVASACEEGGISDFSEWTEFEVFGPSARIENAQKEDYPFRSWSDDASLYLLLEAPLQGQGIIHLNDLTGRSLKSVPVDFDGQTTWQIVRPDYTGIVFVSIESAQGFSTRKVLLN